MECPSLSGPQAMAHFGIKAPKSREFSTLVKDEDVDAEVSRDLSRVMRVVGSGSGSETELSVSGFLTR